MPTLLDCVGLLGISLSLYSYARLQWHRDYAKTLAYSLLNLTGSLLLGLSLMEHWNLASFVSNTAWGLVSAYGVYRCLKYIRRGIAVPNLPKRSDT